MMKKKKHYLGPNNFFDMLFGLFIMEAGFRDWALSKCTKETKKN